MARTAIPVNTTLGSYPSLPIGAGGADLEFNGADPLDRVTPLVDNKTMILAYNSGATPRTITIGSVADAPFNRTGDITAYSVAAGKIACFGPFKSAGWAVSSNLNVDVSHAELLTAAVTLP